ncbi:MAG: glycosyltransferase family 39 protein [Chloroflexi bacterium]|nr:glycosyltransferase family 39 protein [Chloroflexota bacterium]
MTEIQKPGKLTDENQKANHETNRFFHALQCDRKTLYFDLVLLFLISVFFFYMQSYCLSRDQSIPIGNLQGYMNRSVYTYAALKTEPLKFLLPAQDRPSIAFIVSSIFYGLFGFSVKTAYLSSAVFVFLLVPAIYLLGRYFGGRALAWIVILTALGNHFLIFQSRSYFLDFPLLATGTLAFFFFFLAEDFKDTRYSVLFGIAFGLAMLTKFFLPFIIAPLVYMFFVIIYKDLSVKARRWAYLIIAAAAVMTPVFISWMFKSGVYLKLRQYYPLAALIFLVIAIASAVVVNKMPGEKIRLKNFIIANIIAAGMFLPAYLTLMDYFSFLLNFHSNLYSTNSPALYFSKIVMQYFNNVKKFFPMALLFTAAGTIYALSRIKELRYQKLLLGTFGSFFVLMALIKDPEFRYILPLMALAMVLAFDWMEKMPKPVRLIFLALAFLWFATGIAGWALEANTINSSVLSTIHNLRDVYDRKDRNESRTQIEMDMAARIKAAILSGGKKVEGLRVISLNPDPGYRIREFDLDIFLASEGVIPDMMEKRNITGILRTGILILWEEEPWKFVDRVIVQHVPGETGFAIISADSKNDFSYVEKFLEERGTGLKLLREYRMEAPESAGPSRIISPENMEYKEVPVSSANRIPYIRLYEIPMI